MTAPTSDNAEIIEQLRAEVAQLTAELTAARTCPITGLATRRRFTQLANAVYPGAGAVLLADLDDFKAVNDAYGHAAGDELLGELGDRFRSALGTVSKIGRLGGDEFAAVLPISPKPHHLDQVHEYLTDPFTTSRGHDIVPAISLGVILREQLAGHTYRESLHGADLAMYSAKQAGVGWVAYDPELHGPLDVEDAPAQRARHHGSAA